ncbi:hypothetical protein [Rothia aerolata]|uniref:Uncharacterized protein n=1 Tax=Rothia aerolata TaxID=1812262 RepID=A0A917MUT8_9MICC|nr:hypothetical protein [Rothia aerolata]GGH65091.1 hypothetical protein GCM10007359_17990 [Rothia aerolata]
MGRFLYRSEIINPDGVTAEVHVVDDINRSTFVRPSSVQTYPTKFLMVTQSLDSFAYAHLLALRAVIVGKCQKLRIVVHSKKMGSEDLKKLVKTDWIDLQVVVVNPIQDLDYTKRPFSNWIRKRRLNILSSAK